MPDRRLTRRTLLTDLGRVTLGAVVVGGLAGCAADEEPDGSTDGGTERAGGRSYGGDAGSGELAWERAAFGFVSAYVLVRDGEALVFDTGTSDGGTGPIEDALTAAGVGWGDVGHVLVSHRHGDHVGGLTGVLEAAPDAAVYGALPDLDAFRATAGDAATEVVDGDTVLGLRVVATPGHTPGHVAAFDAASGLLLAGDALTNGVTVGGSSGDGIGGSPPDFTDDADAAAASVVTLAGLGPATILVGHGDPVTDAAEPLRTFADSL